MALVTAGFELSVVIIDNGANTSTLRYDLDAVDHATATTDAATILGELNAMTAGVVKGYSIVERYIEDALVLPASGVEVEERAIITVQLNSSPLKKATLVIPAPETSIFVSTSGPQANVVDVANASVIDYVGLFTVTGGVATVSDGEKVKDSPGHILNGRKTHRASSRG